MSKWKMVPVEPTDEMIHAIDGLICSSYLWPVYAYRAMIDAAPVPVGDDCDDILDCYAAESQQFSDEIVSLRASVESARTKAIALESRRDAWRDSAILSQRSASELARQVDQQAAELARLRAENERLKADAAAMADVFSRGHDEGINDCLRNGLDWAHEYMGGQPGKRAKSEQHPSDDNDVQRLRASMCVVMKPRSAVRLGHDCPAVDRLDAAIDAAMAQGDKA